MGFLGSSAGKESICNARNPSSIPVSGRSPREGIGYPLQYSWVSMEAQRVKNPPVMQKIWIWSLGWEYPLEESMATHSSILAWRIPRTEKTGGLQSMGSQESDATEVFWGTSILFSIVAAPIYIPTNSVGGFPFLDTFSSRTLHQKRKKIIIYILFKCTGNIL